MSHLNEALKLLRETQGILKSAYQPMLDPAAGMQGGMPPQGMPPQGMPPQGMPAGGPPPMDPAAMQGGMPPMDPAMMAQAAPPPMDPAMMAQGGAPAPAVDPQVMMEMMSALESVGQALQSLVDRVGSIEQEHKTMMKDYLRNQGEMKVLIQFLKQQAPMGSEVMGASQPPAAQFDPAMLGGRSF